MAECNQNLDDDLQENEENSMEVGIIAAIVAERSLQYAETGWASTLYDADNIMLLERAALCYQNAPDTQSEVHWSWPFADKWWQPQDRYQNLQRAGAFYLAAADVAKRNNDDMGYYRLKNSVQRCALQMMLWRLHKQQSGHVVEGNCDIP